MAWNRSSEGAEKTAKKVAKKPGIARGAIAGLAIVAIGGALVFWLCGPEQARDDADGAAKRGRIKEVTPAKAAKVEEPKPEPPKKVDPNARPTRPLEEVNGYVMLPSGRIHKRVGIITNSASRTSKAWYQIFKRRCNNEIATYISINPGDTLVGTRQYTGKFKDDFIESIKEPIIPTHDDPPEIAQLKRDVNKARLELKDALDRGEDIEQIMIDTREQLQDMMRVKNMLRVTLDEQIKVCKSEEDVEDALNACNQLLESKGIAPLKCNAITKINMWREMREEQELQRAESAGSEAAETNKEN